MADPKWMKRRPFPKMATYKTASAFREALGKFAEEAGVTIKIGVDDEVLSSPRSPLGDKLTVFGKDVNRIAIQPMEGWDGSRDGKPSLFVTRRWQYFGSSGAGIIAGGEATAVRADGRANPNQMIFCKENVGAIKTLLAQARAAHREAHGHDNVVFGWQLTFSGRYSRPDGPWASHTAHSHPILDGRFNATVDNVITDAEIRNLIELYVQAARAAKEIGFDYVDIKACHGYFIHELLGAKTRTGDFGGRDFSARSRMFREIVQRIKSEVPGLGISTRVSIGDQLFPLNEDESWGGRAPSDYHFALNDDGTWNAAEAYEFIDLCRELGIDVINTTAGSPYYSSQLQRAAENLPTDALETGVDPLVGLLQQMAMYQDLKARYPGVVFIGSGISHLQQWLPNVAQWLAREDVLDVMGIGRAFLSTPDLPTQLLKNGVLPKKTMCKGFSACTTAPRKGFISGCFPLVDFFRGMDIWKTVKEGEYNPNLGELPPYPDEKAS